MKTVAIKIFQNLQGTWQLSRDISGSHMAHAAGTAVFEKTLNPYELKYSEEVTIVLEEGKKLNGHQRYIYRLENDNQLNVYFNESELLFHSVECTSLKHGVEHKASHYCQPDTYITSYFWGVSSFQIEHRVSGPKKDYISRTMYNKI